MLVLLCPWITVLAVVRILSVVAAVCRHGAIMLSKGMVTYSSGQELSSSFRFYARSG
jgi:hypothetical protein